jgi:hypothetical protein
MTTSSNNPAAISIKMMCAKVGLSRQSFMQLVKSGVFPTPLYDVATKRPFYNEELQAQVVAVRQTNVGINGKVVMFYSRRAAAPSQPGRAKKKPASAKDDQHNDILAGLKALGMATATTAQVAQAVADLFPKGTGTVDPAEVIRAVFLHLRGKNPGEKVGSKE